MALSGLLLGRPPAIELVGYGGMGVGHDIEKLGAVLRRRVAPYHSKP